MVRHLLWLWLLVVSSTVQAQIALPQVPRVPGLAAVPRVDPLLQGLTSGVTGQTGALVQDVRREASALIRRNRTLLEADPDGYAIVRGELVMFSPTEAELAAAQAAGYAIDRVRDLGALNARVVVLHAPARLATRTALSRLRALAPVTPLDFNHVYLRSGAEAGAAVSSQPSISLPEPSSSEPSPPASPVPLASAKLGLIDGGVDTAHPVFDGVPVQRYGCDGKPVVDAHGTEVASLLVGRSAQFRGAAAGSRLYAADVYCGIATGGAVDAIADAFAWLARERVPVINTSLVGPANATLAAVVRAMSDRGYLIIAAVGNDGPSAPPLYPASYPGVVGVTAVDRHHRALVEAARGTQVKFAAPGADMTAAASPRGFALVRGTSFAAPIVAGLLSNLLQEPDAVAAAAAVMQLAHRAVDLGAPGVDPVYGYGLVGDGIWPSPGLASR